MIIIVIIIIITTIIIIMKMQEDDPNAQPRIVYMHKCVELECWPATAVVSQLHLTHINLSYVIMDDKSKQLLCKTALTCPFGDSPLHYSVLLLQCWCHAALMLLLVCSSDLHDDLTLTLLST